MIWCLLSLATFDVQDTKPSDLENMCRILGVKEMRWGADGNAPATYDLDKANAWMGSLPDILAGENGGRIESVEEWQKKRRRVREIFELEVYGKVPVGVPKVRWEVIEAKESTVGGIEVVTKNLVGKVDNSKFPSVEVNIQASFSVPKGGENVPLMIEFGGWRRPGGMNWNELAVRKGWGYGSIQPGSIQADHKDVSGGIIGLCNQGGYRSPEDWGALRAWGWGVSRMIDYFEGADDSGVDSRRVGIAGLSRYGKAALVAQAFDERIAVGLIGSSGQGGTKIMRRQFGERVENVAGGFPHWMAGNYVKYASADPNRTVESLPVDAHELIALCAPRPVFISHGIPEKGDAHWIDALGSYMAGLEAGKVYELYGKQGFTSSRSLLDAELPERLKVWGGELAWYQHEGGHDITPSWESFFEWVEPYLKS